MKPRPAGWNHQAARAEFEALLEAQLPLMHDVARQLTRSAVGAEDLVQETSLRAYRLFERSDDQHAVDLPELQRDRLGRIKAALDREDADSASQGRAAWRRSVGMSLAAAALIAVGALAPTLLSSAPPRPPAVMNPGQVSGTLLCVECEIALRRPLPGLDSMLPRGAAASPVAAHARLHLRDDSGKVWELLSVSGEAEDEAVQALGNHEFVGKRVTIFGLFEPDLHALRVARLHVN